MKNFSAYQVIDRKKNGHELSLEEISSFINHYVAKKIPDYQMSAFLMSIFFKGMTPKETSHLTEAMLKSGKHLLFKDKSIVDKHSTGGIGDKASFILAPLAAACGVKVPMVAGRGLGFTGGTIDKIEAINNFKTSLTLVEFEKQLMDKGIVLMGQTKEIAPADGLIYALRDVTATIDSIPLITASIMSKKIAEGANGYVFDIKFGSGAFMKDPKKAKELALSLIKTARSFKKKAVALLTDMNQPLGEWIGHSYEIIESIETLKNKGPKDLTLLSVELASHMVYLAGITSNLTKAKALVWEKLKNGEALQKFADLLKWQGADPSVINNYHLLPQANLEFTISVPKSGYLKEVQNDQIGLLMIDLGAGRKIQTDKIDHAIGLRMHHKIGDKMKKGDPLFTFMIHPHQKVQLEEISSRLTKEYIKISTQKVMPKKIIKETIS